MYLVFVLIDALVFLLIDQLGFILKTKVLYVKHLFCHLSRYTVMSLQVVKALVCVPVEQYFQPVKQP